MGKVDIANISIREDMGYSRNRQLRKGVIIALVRSPGACFTDIKTCA